MESTNMPNSTLSTSAGCCDGGDYNVFSIIEIFVLVVGLCSLIISFLVLLREKQALQAQLEEDVAEEDVASQDRKEEMRSDSTRNRMAFILNGLIVKEWVPPNDQLVESMEGHQDNPVLSGEAVEASQPPAIEINSSLVSCAIGSDDCESLAGEEEMAGCAICLSHFKPQQLVCESNNSSCRHIFHKDCMIDWLTKNHDDCPMCREVYLPQTTV
jgi:hypothetical protein